MIFGNSCLLKFCDFRWTWWWGRERGLFVYCLISPRIKLNCIW
jgi:hypothetical protein